MFSSSPDNMRHILMARAQVPAYIYHLYTFCFVVCIINSIQSSSSSILPWIYKCNDNAIIAIQVQGSLGRQNCKKKLDGQPAHDYGHNYIHIIDIAMKYFHSKISTLHVFIDYPSATSNIHIVYL